MAILTLLTTAFLVTITSGYNYGQFFLAGSPWPDNDNQFPGFPGPMVLRFAPTPAPRMPNMPNPFSFFNQFPFPFPTMAPINFPPMPPFPSPEDIANASPPNGGTYSGVVVSSQSTSHTNDDGSVTKKGGSTILVNQDGKVTMTKTGDSPPTLVSKTGTDQNTTTEFDSIDDLKNN